MARSRYIPAFAVLACLVASGGCAGQLGSFMVTSPNAFNPFAGKEACGPGMERLVGADQQFFVPVGPPEASLAVSVVEPKNNGKPAKGTILVLHGIYAGSFWMMGPARTMADAGYRSVLVDLRGHGRSSGDHLTFGVQEAKDLSQVIDELENRRLVEGPIGVYGISYGATCSIHLAGVDPRVKAVVAVAPFSTMRDEVPQFGKTMVPGVGIMIPEDHYQRAIDEAGRRANFDPDRASAVEAIKKTNAQVLLVHGTNDWVVPHKHSLRLHEAAPDHSELALVPWHGHMVIWFDPTSEVAEQTRAWFDRWLADGR